MVQYHQSARLGPLSGLSHRLVANGLLSEADALQAQDDATRHRRPLVSQLVAAKLVSARTIAMAASTEFGVPLVDLRAIDLAHVPVDRVSEKLLRKHNALPLFARGNRLYLGLSDPANLQALDEIKFNTGMAVECILVEEDKLARALEDALSSTGVSMPELDNSDLEALDLGGGDDPAEVDITQMDIDDAPVVRFVNKVLLDAISKEASDIHFEPYEKTYRVRLRQDGILREIAAPPAAMGMRLSARLKVLARLDLAERRIPQDGRIKLNLSKNRSIDFRVSTCPTLYGEKIVLRILDPAAAQMGVDALGFDAAQKKLYLDTIQKPYGMVLVTGPTGSGKTVSLYTALNILNTADRNISTAEDPAEINLPGVNQVNVHPRVGLTFASALRAFLRQDPDVIMVGEIRDLETAEIAIKAAQTGHMVLSTLHTNDAPQTLTRLVNMGVAAYNIASSVSLIIAQRLARRLCKNCKRRAKVPPEELRKEGFDQVELDSLKLFEANPDGCEQCSGGYKGRVGLYQVMPVTDTIGQIIMDGGSADDIERQARADGVAGLRRAGLNRARDGILSLAEVNRVTME